MEPPAPKRTKPSPVAPVFISGLPVKDATQQPSQFSLSADRNPSNSGRKFECIKCGNSFSYRCNLKRHVTRAHKGNVISDLPANSCFHGQPIEDASHQSSQLSLSGGQNPSNSERKIECVECGNVFSKRSNLKRHCTRAHKGNVISEPPANLRSHGHFVKGTTHQPSQLSLNASQNPSHSGQKIECMECGNIFSKRSNLKRHFTRAHKGNVTSEPPENSCSHGHPVEDATRQPSQLSLSDGQNPSNDGKKFDCVECKNSFSRRSSLKRHFSRAHKGKVISEPPAKTFKHSCELCSRNFNYGHHLRAHQRAQHPQNFCMPYVKPKLLHKCLFCPMFMEKQVLFQHYDSEHGTKIEKEDLQFDNIESFLSWKNDLEHNDKCQYIIDYRSEKFHSYKCHRSGYYNGKGKGLRHMRKQGTKKINFLCPSSIKVKLAPDGKCTVSYTKTHIGHQMETIYLKKRGGVLEANAEETNLNVIESNEIDFLSQQLQNSSTATVSRKTDINSLLKEFKDIIQNANKNQLDFIKRNLLHVKASIIDSE